MDDGRSWYLLLSLLFLAFSCFFAASASAMIGVNDAQLKERTENGDKRAEKLTRCLALPDIADRIRTSAIVSTILAEIPAMILTVEPLYRLFSELSGREEESLSHPLLLGSTAVCGVVLTFLFVSLGIKLPQFLGSRYCESFGYKAAKLYPGALWFLMPLVGPIRGISAGLACLFGADPRKTADTVTEEEIRMLVDTGSEMGFIEESQKEMINNIFEFDDLDAGDIMTHRTDMTAAEISDPLSEIVSLSMDNGYSRIPVYDDDPDNIVGIAYVKDLLKYIGTDLPEDVTLRDIIREPVFVPESMPCGDLFKQMTDKHTQMAIVVDEFGGTAGIVTLEDVLESIVGNIQDEYDDEEEEISKIDDTTFTVDGVTYIDELDEVFHVTLPEGDYDTVGGFIISELGYLPQDGEMNVVEYKNLRFTVLNVEDRRIGKVKIEILPVEEEKEDAEDDSKREKGGWFAERREEKDKEKVE